MEMLNLTICDKMANFALEKAEEIGKPISVAIVDSGGHLCCFKRSERGKIANISIAIDKAWTAVSFKDDTINYEERVRPGERAFGLQWTNNSRPVFIRGGLLIKINEEIIGGIGVSGGTGDEDVACCEAGLSVLTELT
jgi:uncharacterized protein GlcG (DUF336 family)